MSSIGLDEHVADFGRTGTGKTFCWRKYLTGETYVVVHDTKGTTKWPEVPKNDISIVKKLEDLSHADTPKIIYRPDFRELTMPYYERFYKWIYMRRNCRVVIDEAMNVCPSPFVFPEWLKGIYTRGRELGVTAWACSQRPMGIPQILISEATHLFIFDLNLPQDRKRIMEVTGIPTLFRRPGKRNFWYYRTGEDEPVKATLVVTQQEFKTSGVHAEYAEVVPNNTPQSLTLSGILASLW